MHTSHTEPWTKRNPLFFFTRGHGKMEQEKEAINVNLCDNKRNMEIYIGPQIM